MDFDGQQARAPGAQQNRQRPHGRSAQTLAKRLAAVTLTLLVAACGGGGGDEPAAEPALPAILAGAPVYGPGTDPLPPGAREVQLPELQRLAAEGELIWFTPATERATGEAEAARRQAARAQVEAALATRPDLAEVLAAPALPPDAVRLAGGSIEVTLPATGEKVLLDSHDSEVASVAQVLRLADSRDNAMGLYQSYLAVLPEDVRAELPGEQAAASLDMPALQDAIQRAADLVLEHVPDESVPGATAQALPDGRARALAIENPSLVGGNCTAAPNSLANDFNYTLKSFLPPTRTQGRRGSCVMFAATAGVEIKAGRLYGRVPDLSEQHAYSVAKYNWFRTSDDVGDGLFTGSTLEELIGANYTFRGEGAWRYNRSPERGESYSGYYGSCTGYDEACSDTNHQLGKVCIYAGSPGNWMLFCSHVRPASTALGLGEQYRLRSASLLGGLGLWGLPDTVARLVANATLTRVRAAVVAGNPVVLDMRWPTCAKNVTTTPTVFGNERDGLRAMLNTHNCSVWGGGGTEGHHALNIVGFVPYAQVLTRYAGNPLLPAIDGNLTTDGYFIVRNSHGCGWGDAGYAYFSSEFIRRHGRAAYSVNLVTAQNLPNVFLFSNRSIVDKPEQTLVLTASVAPTIQRVEFFRSNADDSNWQAMGTFTAAPFVQSLAATSLASQAGKTVRFYARAYDGTNSRVDSPVVQVQVRPGAAGPPAASPTVTLPGSPTAVSSIDAPATVLLRANVTPGTLPIKRVDFYKGLTPVGSRTSPPFIQEVAITTADVGLLGLLVRVEDTAGNFITEPVQINVTTPVVPAPVIGSFTATPATLPLGGGPVTLSWSVAGAASVSINNGVGSVAASGSVVVNPVVSTTWTLVASTSSGSSSASTSVSVAGDAVPPTVALGASGAVVDVPGSVTLTATASDNVGVVAVDFYRGATRIGTDTTPGDGFTQAVAFTSADVGSVSFTAVARDAAGNTGTSTPVLVVVRVPAALGADRWVAPGGSDAHTGSEGAPYLTVGKALANIGANGTVWLAPGSYPWAREVDRNGYSAFDSKVLRIPDTGRVRAVTRGTVTLQFGLQARGSATVSGVHFTLLAADVSDVQPAVISKTASGTLRLERTTFGRMNTLQSSAGGNTLFTAESDDSHEWFTPAFQGAFGRVDVGQTRFLGGRITLNRIPDGANAGVRVWGHHAGTGVISLERLRMTLPEAPEGVTQLMFTPIGGGTLTFFNTQVVQQGTRTSHVLAQSDHLGQVRILNSTVTGPFGQIVSLTAGGNVEVNGSTLSGGVTAIGFAGGAEPGGLPLPSVQILDSTLHSFSAHGLHLPNHGNVLVSGSTLRGNGQSGIFLGGTPNLPWVTANYVLRVQTSTFSGNGSGGANHGGLVLAGSATSTWDLGGSNGNGDNTLLGSSASPALRVAVPAGVRVLAVGNTWSASEQGANASGRYTGELLVLTGSGTNYAVSSGSLQLSY